MKYHEITPARAKSKNPEKLWDDPEWIAEEKFDGWRFLMHFGGELTRTYMTGRRVSKQTNKLSEKGECAPCLWPSAKVMGYTVLDGEVMAPTGYRDIAGIMNTSPEKAEKRIAEIGEPTYHVFDMIWLDGEYIGDKSLLERRMYLNTFIPAVNNPLIKLVPTYSNKLRTYDQIVEQGGEGVILKDLIAPYSEGWVKVKKYSTLDVIVTGFTDAKEGVTGKYLGQIGAARVSVYTKSGSLIEVGRVSGMTDDIRRDMSDNPGQWMGRVIEVAAQEFAKERLRHPRFRRLRDDANPHDATFGKLMADLGMDSPEKQLELSFK